MSINDGTTTVTETLSPSGRVLRRVVTTNATSAVTENTTFGYSNDGDAPSYSTPTGGATVTTHLGGMIDTSGTATWLLTNRHGDVAATVDDGAAFSAAPVTDEFGVGATSSDGLGWLGGSERRSIGGAIHPIRMGVRIYDPVLGRFTHEDPVEGGSANAYDYCSGEPLNCLDLDGRFSRAEHDLIAKALRDMSAANSALNLLGRALRRTPDVKYRVCGIEHRVSNAATRAVGEAMVKVTDSMALVLGGAHSLNECAYKGYGACVMAVGAQLIGIGAQMSAYGSPAVAQAITTSVEYLLSRVKGTG